VAADVAEVEPNAEGMNSGADARIPACEGSLQFVVLFRTCSSLVTLNLISRSSLGFG